MFKGGELNMGVLSPREIGAACSSSNYSGGVMLQPRSLGFGVQGFAMTGRRLP